jgi:hypothetical protein
LMIKAFKCDLLPWILDSRTVVARDRPNWYTGAALLPECQSDNKIPSEDLL